MPLAPGGSDPGATAPVHAPFHRTSPFWLIGFLLGLNVVLLFIGLTGDSVTIGATVMKKIAGIQILMLDSRETFSILSSIAKLWHGGDRFLACVIFGFSVVFPILKLSANLLIWARLALPVSHTPTWMHRTAALLHGLGRWSMLDVFVVGILVVWGKTGGVSRFLIEPALYFFFAAAIIAMANALLTEKVVGNVSRDKGRSQA